MSGGVGLNQCWLSGRKCWHWEWEVQNRLSWGSFLQDYWCCSLHEQDLALPQSFSSQRVPQTFPLRSFSPPDLLFRQGNGQTHATPQQADRSQQQRSRPPIWYGGEFLRHRTKLLPLTPLALVHLSDQSDHREWKPPDLSPAVVQSFPITFFEVEKTSRCHRIPCSEALISTWLRVVPSRCTDHLLIQCLIRWPASLRVVMLLTVSMKCAACVSRQQLGRRAIWSSVFPLIFSAFESTICQSLVFHGSFHLVLTLSPPNVDSSQYQSLTQWDSSFNLLSTTASKVSPADGLWPARTMDRHLHGGVATVTWQHNSSNAQFIGLLKLNESYLPDHHPRRSRRALESQSRFWGRGCEEPLSSLHRAQEDTRYHDTGVHGKGSLIPRPVRRNSEHPTDVDPLCFRQPASMRCFWRDWRRRELTSMEERAGSWASPLQWMNWLIHQLLTRTSSGMVLDRMMTGMQGFTTRISCHSDWPDPRYGPQALCTGYKCLFG